MKNELIKKSALVGVVSMASLMAGYASAGAVHTFKDNIDFTDPLTYTTKLSEITDDPSGWTTGKPNPIGTDGGGPWAPKFKKDDIFGLYMTSVGHDDAVWYTHDISDSGYSSADFDITDAMLYLSFHDDKGVHGGDDKLGESAEVDLLGFLSGDPLFEVDNATYSYTVDGVALVDLKYDGDLHVAVRAEAGDFYLQKSKLKVKAAHVPEPASLALLGLGLAGLAGVRKLKKA